MRVKIPTIFPVRQGAAAATHIRDFVVDVVQPVHVARAKHDDFRFARDIEFLVLYLTQDPIEVLVVFSVVIVDEQQAANF